MSGHYIDLGIDFSKFVLPPTVVKEDPLDFSDPEYDQAVKKAVRSVEEMKAFGWHDTCIATPSEKIADRIESLLRTIKEIKYTRNKLSFDIFWTDEIIEAEQPVPVTEPVSAEELALLEVLMQDLDFGF